MMKRFATIRHRPTYVRGWPNSGWHAADPSEPGARSLPFHFEITDDGAGGYVLAYASEDGAYVADSAHPTLEASFRAAEEMFGVARLEWEVAG